ncbi:MAG: FAD-dependent oxidoreductase, partial [Steroidobacteraceae bacterium]
MSARRGAVNIVGAGLSGPLLAILLARRGFSVTLSERRDDPRHGASDAGRSINLALAARGIRALEQAGLMDRVRPLLIPMRGRRVHEPARAPRLLPYGQREEEVIYSIGRGALNRLLIEEAARHADITLRFAHACAGVPIGRESEAPLTPTIAADGAGSAVRASLAAQGLITVREEPLDHDYKELAIPAREGRRSLDPNALHIWPRRGFMLIALPNTDGSFTSTLFLPREGPVSFAALAPEGAVEGLFASELADALPLIPDLAAQFREHPQSRLGTVHAAPWHVGGAALLLGDAAHAIVPFHGQGMNAGFEDAV